MKNTKRKGFTIVELVIVIAVIAILAAVLIPTFASLINKANRSADIQAVHQMNTQLAIDEVDSNKTIVDVYAALEEGGMTAKDYTSLASNTYFFWDSELNRILYTNDKYEVQYPEKYKDVTSKTEGHQWFSLSGKIEEVPVEKGTDGTYTIENAEQLYWLSQNVKTISDNSVTVKLPTKLDLMGANAAFILKDTNITTLKLEGNTDGTTISNFVLLDSTYSEKGKDYGAGFVAYVDAGKHLEISNITIDHATVGGYEIGGVGGLIGRIENDEAQHTVKVKNCNVTNSTINGKNKVGALIGSIGSSEVTVEDCEVKKCTVNCSEGESGKAIGAVYNSKLSLTIDKAFNEWVDEDTTLNLVTTDKRDVVDYSNVAFNATNIPEGCQKVVRVVKNGVQKNKYRMFADDAYMTFIMECTPISVKICDNEMQSFLKSISKSATINESKADVNIIYFFKKSSN